MTKQKKLLFLSNGHGEDQIAAALITKISKLRNDLSIAAMPLVGEGRAYAGTAAEKIGPAAVLPSGGFMRLGIKNLLADVRGGLIGLTIKQVRALRSISLETDLVVVSGDVFLLLMAGIFVRKPIVFYAAAKSEYINGHFRLEKRLIKALAAKTFTRDRATAGELQNWGIPAQFLGNPALDTVEMTGAGFGLPNSSRVIGFLPGSRHDAYMNISTFLEIIRTLAVSTVEPLEYLISFYPELSIKQLQGMVNGNNGWKIEHQDADAPGVMRITNGNIKALVVIGQFGDIINRSRLVVGVSGTGNEQAAGLGKPVVAFATTGSQYNSRFMEAQKKLLGKALAAVPANPQAVAEKVLEILGSDSLYKTMSNEGLERMGEAGGALRIAGEILRLL